MGRRARKGGGRQVVVEIEIIGGRGDGVATFEGRPVFVPASLPGDCLRVRLTAEKAGGWRGEPLELLEKGPGRSEPRCRHFGPCGGCQLQHLEDTAYRTWKADLLTKALDRAGIQAEAVSALHQVPPYSRRRAVLAVRRSGEGVELGFRERFSHRIVALKECHILIPGLFNLCHELKRYILPFLHQKKVSDLFISEMDNGFDVVLSGADLPNLQAREVFADPDVLPEIKRFSWSPSMGEPVEPVIQRAEPEVRIGGISVSPPPGGFLQPTTEGEALLGKAVLEALPRETGPVLDLFSGCGTFSFLLSELGPVRAIEGDQAACRALQNAVNRSGLSGRIIAEHRDLFRQPLRPEELNEFDAVVFDPPRSGAREQACHLAASNVPRVIGVSCNPATFARDAALLIEGGYRLASVVPVDQFLWSAHLEVVGVFVRA